jgi:hypothetical protein
LTLVRHAEEGIEPPAILAPRDDGAEALLRGPDRHILRTGRERIVDA